MKDFKTYEQLNIQSSSKKQLDEIEENVGFVPNVYATVAVSAVGLDAFITLTNCFQETAFSDTEKQIILLATSTENQCEYCVAGHTTFSEMLNVPKEYVRAMRDGKALSNQKLDALNQFARALVRERGRVPEQQLARFFEAGYSQSDAVDIIMGISLKTFSNLTSILMDIPIDDAFKKNAWSPENNIAAA